MFVRNKQERTVFIIAAEAFNKAQEYTLESASIYAVGPSSLYAFNDRWVQITLHKNI